MKLLIVLTLLLTLCVPVLGSDEQDPADVVEFFCSVCPECCEVVDWWAGAWGTV